MAGSNGKSRARRGSVFSEENIRKMAAHVRDGLSLHDAAVMVGVDPGYARREEKKRTGLFQAVARARIQRKLELIQQVKRGVMASGKKGDWKAAMRLLESWEAEEYATTQQVEMRVKNEHSDFLQVARDVLPEEMWTMLLEAYARRYGGDVSEAPASDTVH